MSNIIMRPILLRHLRGLAFYTMRVAEWEVCKPS